MTIDAATRAHIKALLELKQYTRAEIARLAEAPPSAVTKTADLYGIKIRTTPNPLKKDRRNA